MDFAHPLWLIGGFATCLGMLAVFRLFSRKRQAALEKFAAHQLIGRLTRNISGNRRRLKNGLLLGAVLLSFAALARPQYGSQWVEVRRQGIDLLFALDTSKSMLAEDIKPNRLQRAHLAIQDFVEKLDGDRVGLLPFAGTAYLMCPLTIDYDAFLYSLSVVDTDLIPQGGTNIAAVINKAVEVLSNGANHKILIIITDGENLQGDALQAAETAAKQGLTIYTVGVGTSQGELIPLADSSGQRFVKDKAGNFVTSRLDEATLRQIAEKTGGISVLLGPSGEGLETIYRQKLSLIPKEELAERRHKLPIERFEWPLALAAGLLVGEMLVGERKANRRLPLPSLTRAFALTRTLGSKLGRRGKTGALILLLLVIFSGNGYGSEGEDAYRRGDYLQASEYYRKKLTEKPDDPQLQYNFGTTAYKNNLYDEAIQAFTGALRSDQLELQKKAYFNRGNSYYQKGAEIRQGDPQGAAEKWRQSLESLKSALALDPQDVDARHNRDLVEKELTELEKQLEKEKKEQPPAEQNQQDSDQKKEGQENPQPPETGSEKAGQEQTEQRQTDQQQAGQQHPGQPQPGEQEHGDAQEQPAGALEAAGSEQPPPEEQAQKDALRRQLGKMTKEEAERLLNGLKNEEGNLNFVPSGQRSTDRNPDRDW